MAVVYVLYLIVLAAAGIVVPANRRRRINVEIVGDVPDVHPYTAATLESGHQQVALTVLCEMVDSGLLDVEKGGWVGIRSAATVPADPMFDAVLRAFKGRTQMRADPLLTAVARQPEMHAPEEPARRRGLLLHDEERHRLRMLPWPLTAISGIGLVGIFAGIRHAPSVLILTPFVVFGLTASIGLMVGTPRHTSLGKRALAGATRFYRGRPRPETVTVEGRTYRTTSLGVALHGRREIQNLHLSKALYHPDNSNI